MCNYGPYGDADLASADHTPFNSGQYMSLNVINPHPDKLRVVWPDPPLTLQSIFFKGVHIFQIAFMTLLLGPWATVYTFERPYWFPVNPCLLVINPIVNIAQSDEIIPSGVSQVLRVRIAILTPK